MKKWTTLAIIAALPATAAVAAVPYGAMPPGFEAPHIRTSPIAGVVNQQWYNYKADEVDGSRSRHLGAKMGCCHANPSRGAIRHGDYHDRPGSGQECFSGSRS